MTSMRTATVNDTNSVPAPSHEHSGFFRVCDFKEIGKTEAVRRFCNKSNDDMKNALQRHFSMQGVGDWHVKRADFLTCETAGRQGNNYYLGILVETAFPTYLNVEEFTFVAAVKGFIWDSLRI